MDAQAYLMRHGWSGPGNPLNPNRRPGQHGGLGLTRPLLISRRETKIGVGKIPTKDPTNQWWLRGFEEALRGVGRDGGATNVATGDANNTASDSLTRNGSQLYKFFVRGEVIPGTLQKKTVDKELDDDKKEERKKRKRDRDEDDDDSNKQKDEKEKKRKKRKTDEPETAKIKKVKKEKKSKKEKSSTEEDAVSSSDGYKADSTELKGSKRRKRREESSDTDSAKKAEKRKRKKQGKMEALLMRDEQKLTVPVNLEEKKKSDKTKKEKKRKKKDS